MAGNTTCQKLFEFCAAGDRIGLANYIIISGCNPNAYDVRNSAGKTALHVACQHGHLFTVRSLIEIFGCSRNAKDNNGNLPIHDACLKGHLSVVDYLIQFKGVSVAQAVLVADSEGSNLFHKACQSGSVPLVRYLMEILCYRSKQHVCRKLNLYLDSVGCYVNISSQKMSAYTKSALIHCLLTTNEYGDTPLNVACRHGHLSILKVFKAFVPFMAEYGLEASATQCNHVSVAVFIANFKKLPFLEIDSESLSCSNSLGPSLPQQFDRLEEAEPMFSYAIGYKWVKKVAKCQRCNMLLAAEEISEFDNKAFIGICPKCVVVRSEMRPFICPNCISFYDCHGYSKTCTDCHAIFSFHLSQKPFFLNDSESYNEKKCGYDVPCKSGSQIALESANLTVFCQFQRALRLASSMDQNLLHAACVSDNKKVVAYVIKTSGCSANVRDSKGNTPLHVACQWGSRNALSHLSDFKDLQIAVLNEDKDSPLSLACKHNYTDFCKQLLKKFDCTSIPYPDGETPLHLASSNNNLELVKIVLENGGVAFVNTADKYGDTPLFNACRSGNLEMVNCFLKVNSNPYHVNTLTKDTPVHVACRMGRSDILEALLSKTTLKAIFVGATKNFVGATPPQLAIEGNYPEVIKVLIRYSQIDFSQTLNTKGWTLAHFVAISEHLHLAESLLKVDSVDWSAQDSEGNTALHLACCMENNTEMVKLIVKHFNSSSRILITIQNSSQQTPVHIASNNSNIEIINSLLTEFSDSLDDYKDTSGDTALHTACKAGASLDVISTLCQFCSVTIKNNDLQIPLHITCKKGNAKIADLLLRKLQSSNIEDFVDKDGNLLLHAAVDSGCLDTVMTVLQHTSLICINTAGESPIHISCRKGNLEITRAILAKIENKVVYSGSGDSYLHSACCGNSLEVVKFLVKESGLIISQLFVANEQGNSPLHCACLVGARDIISLLISSSSSDILKLNKNGLTPFCCLLVNQHVNTVRFMLTTYSQIKFCTSEQPLMHCILKCCKDVQSVFNLVQFILVKNISDPLQFDSKGNTILHSFLCQISDWDQSSCYSHWVKEWINEILDLFLALPGILFNEQNNNGDTPLHIIVQTTAYSYIIDKLLEKLLDKGLSDSIHTLNKEKKTPVQLAKSDFYHILIKYGANPSDVISKYRDILNQHKSQHPLEPLMKVIAIGNSAAGKTTLVKTLQQLDSPQGQHSQASMEARTAGIHTSDYTSKKFGHVKFHDFGGHPEFESGNAVFLRSLAVTDPPVFLLLVNIQDDLLSLEKRAQFWYKYIQNNMPPQLEVSPHVIIVGSHRDCVPSDKHDKIKECITSAVKKVSDFQITDLILLDCREVDTEQIKTLSGMLTKCCSSLERAIKIDCRCHILFAYLFMWYRGHPAVKFHDLQAKITNDSNRYSSVLLPCLTEELMALLKSLQSMGHIDMLFPETANSCWILIENNILFQKAIEILFASEDFGVPKLPQDPIVSEKMLISLFEIEIDLITSFLTKSEFCHKINDPEILQVLRSACTKSSQMSTTTQLCDSSIVSAQESMEVVEAAQSDKKQLENFYFFPGFVKRDRPPAVWENSSTPDCFGWYLLCYENHFFSSLFLQILLLRLTFNFAVPENHLEPDSLQRKRDIWKNGIHWCSRKGVEVLVEVVQQNTAVLLLMRFTKGCEMEGVKYRSQVIKKILDTKEEFCPNTEVAEYLLTECSKYPPSDSSFVHIAEVAQTIRECEYCAFTSAKNTVDLKALLYFDPYLNNKLLNYLWKEEVEPGREADLPAVSQVLDLQIDLTPGASERQIEWWKKGVLNQLESCSGKLSYLELREKFDAYSIFCGRNPLELSSLQEPPQQLCEKSLSGMTVHVAMVQTESTKSVDHQKANETDGISLQDESTISTDIPNPAASHLTDRNESADPKPSVRDQMISTLPMESSHKCNPTRQVLSIQKLKEEFNISDNQLDQRIESPHDIDRLAHCFDNVDNYVDMLPRLGPGDRTDIRQRANTGGTKAAMKEAIKLMIKRNPLVTTYRELVEIVLTQEDGKIASGICQYISDSCEGSEHPPTSKRQRTS